MEDFAGRTAVVTGAASGMGRAFAQRFAEEGMHVVLGDVEAPALELACRELADAGHDVRAVVTDVSRRGDIEALAEATLSAFGAVDLVCNNAGVEGYLDGPLWEATEKDWTWTFGVNYWSVVYGVATFLPLLLENPNGGHLVNTASMTAVTRGRNMYSITKHGVLALTEVLYGELADAGANVGVSALCPGTIATRLFHGSRNRPAAFQNETAPSGSERGAQVRALLDARLAEGMAPSTVADILVAGIRARQLYILTDHDWDPEITARHEAIMSRTNPDLSNERSARR